MRWLYHLVRRADLAWDDSGRYAPPSLAREGFVHASFLDVVESSARVHFAGVPTAELAVLSIDPRRLDVPVSVVETPRGPMPHVLGSIPQDSARVSSFDALATAPDRVTGTRVGFAAFRGMTLLDLVGPLDAVSRISSMGFEPETRTEVFALTRSSWSGSGAELVAQRYRPALSEFDVLVIPGGFSTRELVHQEDLVQYLTTFPPTRRVASVCTGALLLGAAGRLRGREATTHASALSELSRYGATPRHVRVVEAGPVVTAAGVSAGLDLGLWLVRWLEGDTVAEAVARQMELR
jgi:cyclohexyl-isocyanide hydratase